MHYFRLGPGLKETTSIYLQVVSTDRGIVKIWDVSKRDARLHSHPISVRDKISDFGTLVSAKANCSATHVSVVVQQPDGSPDPKLYIIDVERDVVR